MNFKNFVLGRGTSFHFTVVTSFFIILLIFINSLPCLAKTIQNQPITIHTIPKSLSICGEKMPLEDRSVFEMLDREFTISIWDRAQVIMWLKRAGRYFPFIEKKLTEADMPKDLKYLAVAESSLIIQIRSQVGAYGPWQFMTHTARRNGLRKDHSMDERLSYERSTAAAIKHLKRLKKSLGTWALALAAYNCGEACIKKEMKKQKTKDYYRLNLPLETERFVYRIAAIKIIMENPKRFGFDLPAEQVYSPIPCDVVTIKIRVPLHMTDVAKALNTDFKVIKELNPHILGYYLPKGRHDIKVPPGSGRKLASVVKSLTRTASPPPKEVPLDTYVVKRGDTLSGIAKREGISISALRELNGIKGSLIMLGQKLQLPR